MLINYIRPGTAFHLAGETRITQIFVRKEKYVEVQNMEGNVIDLLTIDNFYGENLEIFPEN